MNTNISLSYFMKILTLEKPSADLGRIFKGYFKTYEMCKN